MSLADNEKVEHNSERIEDLMRQINELPQENPDSEKKIKVMMEEIEKELVPIKDKAAEKGYLMTPVVVVNDKVKAAGYVPEREKMIEWIRAEIK